MAKKPVTICLIILFCLIFTLDSAEAFSSEDISAKSAVLMDRSSGRILFAKNENERLPMASTTKIMTGILAVEHGNLNSRIIISERAFNIEGSSIWLEKGEVKTLEELVYGLMLRSGNDAAVAIAEHLAGSVEDFSVMMTEKAREIGAYNTQFKNPHGLDEDGHVTTAYDLGLITCHALKIPLFREIIATKEKKVSWPGHEWDRFLRNQNKLLNIYPGGDGVKTGWTTPAGRCFVGSATRDSLQLVTVVLNAPNMWEDTTTLLDYGFANWKGKKLISKGQYVKTELVEGGTEEKVKLVAGEEFNYPLKEGEEEYLEFDIIIDSSPVRAPVHEGQVLGRMVVNHLDKEIKSIDLLAGKSVSRKGLFYYLCGWLEKWLRYTV